MAEQPLFDVFLAHSSQDKPLIRRINRQLKERNLNPWLDEEQIPPGSSFQDEIQRVMTHIKSVAVCIGTHGLGRWQAIELKGFISQCIERDVRVIPVLLPGVDKIPDNLLFLREFHAVRFEQTVDDENALFLLTWGITGQKTIVQVAQTCNFSKKIAGLEAEDELRSEKLGDNYYANLRDLLKTQDWKAADQETRDRMYAVMGRQKERWLRREDIEQFPCQDLRVLADLWEKYSKGRFGFRVQKKIWQECGSPTQYNAQWEEFSDRVGWRKDGQWLDYNQLHASLSYSQGLFPFWLLRSWGSGLVVVFFSRVQTCNV
jgi:GUN4-like/TIR domain